MNQKYIFSLLAIATFASFVVAFWQLDNRSKELFFGFAGTIATGSFALITPRKDDGGKA